MVAMGQRMPPLGALVGGVALVVGCSSGAQVVDPEQRDSLWRESSTELIIESWSLALSPLNGTLISSHSSCARYLHSQMSEEQLMYLRTLQPKEVELRGLCDAASGTVVTIVDADSSLISFKTDDSTAGCGPNELEIALPATVKAHFTDGLPCVGCGPANPCAEGVCAEGVCAN
jgi:hypothetical protein